MENPLPAQASNDDIEAAFYSLLHRVSSQRRVVVLLDALDQFEPTPRGRYLTWFKPLQWPANARLIATAIPSSASHVLAEASGTAEIDVPPLSADDAQAIGTHVWGRYHRTLNPAVLAVLIDKQVPDGTPACGNPLWLTLALEQLNLLDADDFARAERDFPGSPGERLAALLLDTARRMPPDVENLYGWLLEQNEKAYGMAATRAFATAIALSRNGWRDTDLLDLVPRLSSHFKNQQSSISNRQSSSATDPAEAQPQESDLHPKFKIQNSKFDILALASIRRSFRAHLVRRGEHEQLDFFHAQMRRAVLDRCVPDAPARPPLHAAISDFLESLPASDPLIRLERMTQLIGERNATRAATYYATVDASGAAPTERLGSTWTLVDWIAEAEQGAHASSVPPAASCGRDPVNEESPNNPHLAWITSWLDQAELANELIYQLTCNFQFGLFKRMENDVVLPTRQCLVEATRRALQRLAAADPSNAGWQRDLSVSQEKIGDVLLAQGDLAGALRAFRESLAVRERLAAADPSNAGWQRDLSVSLTQMAQLHERQGDRAEALRHAEASFRIDERLASMDPTNVTWQNDVRVSRSMVERLAGMSDSPLSAVGSQAPSGHPAPSGPASPPRVSQTPAVTPKTMTPEELRTRANENFHNQQWEAAETYYTRLLNLGEPLAEVVPRLVDCLLNAHDELLPGTCARIVELLAKLESAGHTALARDIRATYTARLPKKPWWKRWG